MQITVAHAALSTRAHARNGTPGILVIEFPVGKRQGKKLSGEAPFTGSRVSHCAFRQEAASFDKTFLTIFL
jgi:hypothetical protein